MHTCDEYSLLFTKLGMTDTSVEEAGGGRAAQAGDPGIDRWAPVGFKPIRMISNVFK
jgi:hypothetical protein